MVTPLLKKWKERFPNVSDVENATILRKAVIIATRDVTDARNPATLLQSVRSKRSPRKPTANGGENRRKKKKQKKQGGIHSVEDTPTEPVKVDDPEDRTAWPMFTIIDSHARCKEFIVPVLIDGKSVDMELDTGASVTIVPKSVWNDVLTAKPLQ